MNNLDCLKDNVEYLTERGEITPQEADAITSAFLPEGYVVEASEGNPEYPTLRIKSGDRTIYYYSRHDPAKEACRKAAALPAECDSLVIMGAGLGYELEIALKSRPSLRRVAIVDNEPALIKAALGRVSMNDYPEIEWHIWAGDLNERNVSRIMKILTSTEFERMGLLTNSAFESSRRDFMFRYLHTIKMEKESDTIYRLWRRHTDVKIKPASQIYLTLRLFELPFPKALRIEPTNYCNLRCRMCPTPGYPKEKKGFMDMALFERIIAELRELNPKDRYSIALYLGGEPLLHKHLCDMIKLASDNDCDTQINTNAVALTEEMSGRLIEAGLKYMLFSFDDVGREMYEQLRAGAKYETVYNNILTFARVRERMGAKNPAMIIAALKIPRESADADSPDIPSVSQEFKDLFAGIPIGFNLNWAHHWASDFDADVDGMRPRSKIMDYYPCSMLWDEVTIRWDGTVVPCCYDLRGEEPLGKFPDERLIDIWNGKKIVDLRTLHLAGRLKESKLCYGCSAMRNYSMLENFLDDCTWLYKRSVKDRRDNKSE